MKLYAGDFGGRRAHAGFAAQYLPEVAERLGEGDTFDGRIGYGDYDWTVATGA